MTERLLWIDEARIGPESPKSVPECPGSGKLTQLAARAGTNESWLKIEGVEGEENASADTCPSEDRQVEEYKLGEETEKLLSGCAGIFPGGGVSCRDC